MVRPGVTEWRSGPWSMSRNSGLYPPCHFEEGVDNMYEMASSAPSSKLAWDSEGTPSRVPLWGSVSLCPWPWTSKVSTT
ncbi:MAG TPA: hypothetical protein VG435_11940 [Acidimicrobiales bacterium]|nr:hypothetical protein [Acidimicrobiales bacterium]